MRRAIQIALTLAAATMLAGCFGDRTYLPSPYPHPREYDVWVNGKYVGSDPDPRIRATLRNEARESHNLR
jgi:hypothetical protein